MAAQTDPTGPLALAGEPTLYLLASIGNLALAILVIRRAKKVSGAGPLALLCLALFLWEASEFAWRALEIPHSRYLRLVGSSMAPAFLFHFVLHFVRREQDYRRQQWLLYGITALFALMTASALFNTRMKEFVDDQIWNVIYLIVLLPFLLFAMVLLMRRLKEVTDRTERNALNFIALGVGIGAVTGLTDLTTALGGPLPPLGHLGSIAMTIILAIAIYRLRLLETEIPFQQINVILVVVGMAALTIFFLAQLIGPDRGDVLILGTVVLTVFVLVVYRFVLVTWYERRERNRRLALLGSMAAGVAHEVKNPLAAIKGSAQFVQKELENRRGLKDAKDYLQTIVDEANRLNSVVENFLDYAKPLTPDPENVQLGELVDEIISAQRALGGAEVKFDANGAPDVSADPALLRHAISNILRNASDAAGEKGEVKVRIRKVEGDKVGIEIEDNGPGIPREKLEEIFQPFFTTKARGTGLGLAIAQRIMEGHGGTIRADNVEPNGARFTLLLPTPAV